MRSINANELRTLEIEPAALLPAQRLHQRSAFFGVRDGDTAGRFRPALLMVFLQNFCLGRQIPDSGVSSVVAGRSEKMAPTLGRGGINWSQVCGSLERQFEGLKRLRGMAAVRYAMMTIYLSRLLLD
jgi:hypothetical protein